MSNHEPVCSASEFEAATSIDGSACSSEPDYALGSECAEPALQIEDWTQGQLALL